MRRSLHCLLFVAAASCAYAQTLAPELAPAAARYKADIAALEAQRATALAQVQQPYLAALGAAEKTATASGNVPLVAAITKERAALNSGLMAPAFPAGLPKDLQGSRKTYLDASARYRASEASRRQTIDAAYLRILASLQPKAAGNPELAQQVAAEKEKLLTSAVPGATGAGGSGKPSGKSAVVNGTFDLTDDKGRPSGWTLSREKDVSIKVVRDGANNVLHLGSDGQVGTSIFQEIPVPPGAKSMTLSGRVRGKWETRDEKETKAHAWGAVIAANRITADDKQVSLFVMQGGRDVGWKTFSSTAKIPAGSKAMHVYLQALFVTGNFDFDDIAVEFH